MRLDQPYYSLPTAAVVVRRMDARGRRASVEIARSRVVDHSSSPLLTAASVAGSTRDAAARPTGKQDGPTASVRPPFFLFLLAFPPGEKRPGRALYLQTRLHNVVVEVERTALVYTTSCRARKTLLWT